MTKENKKLRPAAAYYAALDTVEMAARNLKEAQRRLGKMEPDAARQMMEVAVNEIETANEVLAWVCGRWEEVQEDLHREAMEMFDSNAHG